MFCFISVFSSPRTASVTCRCGLWMMQIDTWPWSHICWGHMVLTGPQVCKWVKFYIFRLSEIDFTWPLTFICDLWPHEHVTVSTNQVWFQSDFNFSNEVNFTFWAHLTTWPLMTFDLGIWPLTTWTYKGSHNISISQVWFQSNSTFQMRWILHFEPILQLDLRWPLTLICDLWPHQQMRFPMLHLWPNFGWNTLKHVEVRAKC